MPMIRLETAENHRPSLTGLWLAFQFYVPCVFSLIDQMVCMAVGLLLNSPLSAPHNSQCGCSSDAMQSWAATLSSISVIARNVTLGEPECLGCSSLAWSLSQEAYFLPCVHKFRKQFKTNAVRDVVAWRLLSHDFVMWCAWIVSCFHNSYFWVCKLQLSQSCYFYGHGL